MAKFSDVQLNRSVINKTKGICEARSSLKEIRGGGEISSELKRDLGEIFQSYLNKLSSKGADLLPWDKGLVYALVTGRLQS